MTFRTGDDGVFYSSYTNDYCIRMAKSRANQVFDVSVGALLHYYTDIPRYLLASKFPTVAL